MTRSIFFQHGWGFDRTTWKEWLPYSSYRTVVADRGYFSAPKESNHNTARLCTFFEVVFRESGFQAGINFSGRVDLTLPEKLIPAWKLPPRNPIVKKCTKPSTDIVITHSLGLHFLSPLCLENCRLLVIISGFQEFHPIQPKKRTMSQNTILKMEHKLRNREKDVLLRFYQRCGVPASFPSFIQWNTLHQDLQYLNTHRLDVEALKNIPQVLLLHGEKDAIVSVKKSEELLCAIPSSTLIRIPDAGHALPMTHVKQCWNEILKHLPRDTSPFKAQIAQAFSGQARAYHQHAKLQKQAAKHLFKLAPLPHTLPPKPIIEIGCGTGFITKNLLERYKNHPLIITDLAPGMLRVCQENIRSALHMHPSPVDFRIQDGEHLAGGPYSLIISGMTFQWFHDLPRALSQLFFSLEKGGFLLFSYLEHSSFSEWKQMTSLCNLPFTGLPLPKHHEIQTLAKTFDPQAQTLEKTMSITYPSVQDFFRTFKRLGAHITSSTLKLSQEQWKQLLKTWKEHRPDQLRMTYKIEYVKIQRRYI